MRIRTLAGVAALVLLANCARIVPPAPPQPAPPVPRPTPAPAPAPAPPPASSDWRDWPVTQGTWTYRQDGRGSLALFGAAGMDAELTLRCDRNANAIFLSRRGAGTGGSLTVRTTSLTRAFPAQPTGGTPAYVATRLSPQDGILDAMGYSRGRFIVEIAPFAPLVIPAWAEVQRVVEDCRS